MSDKSDVTVYIYMYNIYIYIYIYIYGTGSRQIRWLQETERLSKQRFIRGFILQLCIFRLCCNFEEHSLHFGRVSATV